MGNCIYFLTTQHRMVRINGEMKPVYLLKYAYKDSFDSPPKSALMTEGRLQKAWDSRETAEYVTSDFSDGSPIYRWHGRGVTTNDGGWGLAYFPALGLLRGEGKTLTAEMDIELIVPDEWDTHKVGEKLYHLLDEGVRFGLGAHTSGPYQVSVYVRNPAHVERIKTALGLA